MIQKKILLFAPHPDDEIIGCGGYLAQHVSHSQIQIIIVTNGEHGLNNISDSHIRQSECLAGLDEIGINQEQVVFWNFVDNQIPLHGQIVQLCREFVQHFNANEILLPAPTEQHPDHRRVTRAILKSLTNHWQGNLLFYETISSGLSINHSIDISDYFSLKTKALAHHKTQTEQFDYLSYIENLNQMRGCVIGTKYAEGYQSFYWDGSPQNFFETRPLISVIVRAYRLDLLKFALRSLIQQDYDQFEVALIWFGEPIPETSEPEEFQYLDLKVVQGSKNRSENLNLGIESVNGEYICFLDEDDILYPNHFSSLLSSIHGFSDIDMVYSGSRVVSCHQSEQGVKVEHEVTTINRSYNPGCLLVGNLFPIHSVLIRRSILRAHRFDPEMDIYEDWLFFGNLYLNGYTFQHVDIISNEYRVYDLKEKGYGAFQAYHDKKGYGQWRKKVLAHFSKKLSATHLQHLSDRIDCLEQQNTDLKHQLGISQQDKQRLTQQVNHHKQFKENVRSSLNALGIEAVGNKGIHQWLGRSLPQKKQFSILIPTFNTSVEQLSQAILSIIEQSYSGWELCLADDGSKQEATRNFIYSLKEIPELKDKIKVHFSPQQGGIVSATMQAYQLSEAPYLLLMDHDDILHEDALLSFYLELNEQDYQLLYSDSQMIDHSGHLLHIYSKSTWAPETLLSLNYINHPTLIHRDCFEAIGGLDGRFEGGQDLDMLLRISTRLKATEVCYIPKALYDWRATVGSTAYSGQAKPQTLEKGRRAIQKHLQSLGLKTVEVNENPMGPGYVSQWSAPLPSIEIIIPTHNSLSHLRTCIYGLLENTDYPNFTIKIVANRCQDQAMLDYLETLSAKPNIQVLTYNRAFNWSAINNFVARESSADAILCLNDDIEIIHSDWLRKLSKYLVIQKVGAVGALLKYPNGEIQHNGIQLHPQHVASNITDLGCKSQLSITRNVSAVTGACLLIPTHILKRVGYFDESLWVNYGDVDICLTIRQHGQRIVQANDVQLIHHEMASRGPIDNDDKKAEIQSAMTYMLGKWNDNLQEQFLLDYKINAQGTRILSLE